MTGRDVALLALGALLIVVAVTLAILTADMEPCWPNCGGAS